MSWHEAKNSVKEFLNEIEIDVKEILDSKTSNKSDYLYAEVLLKSVYDICPNYKNEELLQRISSKTTKPPLLTEEDKRQGKKLLKILLTIGIIVSLVIIVIIVLAIILQIKRFA